MELEGEALVDQTSLPRPLEQLLDHPRFLPGAHSVMEWQHQQQWQQTPPPSSPIAIVCYRSRAFSLTSLCSAAFLSRITLVVVSYTVQ